MEVDHETPAHSTDGDRSVFSNDRPGCAEGGDPFNGPLYAAIAHAPLGAIVLGVVAGVLSGLLSSTATLIITAQIWPAVAMSVATWAALLWIGWVWMWRTSETGHRWLQIVTATTMALVLTGLGVLVGAVVVNDNEVTAVSWTTIGVIAVFAVAIMVHSIRDARGGLDPDTTEQRRTNLRALVGVGPPGWVTDHDTRLQRIETLVRELAAHRPIPVRAATLGEWWQLRPSGGGPHRPVDHAIAHAKWGSGERRC